MRLVDFSAEDAFLYVMRLQTNTLNSRPHDMHDAMWATKTAHFAIDIYRTLERRCYVLLHNAMWLKKLV